MNTQKKLLLEQVTSPVGIMMIAAWITCFSLGILITSSAFEGNFVSIIMAVAYDGAMSLYTYLMVLMFRKS